MKSFKKVLFVVLSCCLVISVGAACNCAACGGNGATSGSSESSESSTVDSSIESSSAVDSSIADSSVESSSIEESSEIESSSDEESSEAEMSSDEESSEMEVSSGEESSEEEFFDVPKTILHIKNWAGPYGDEWLNSAIARFEAKYAETVFEDGKKGVKVQVENDKASFDANREAMNKFALYFGHDVDLQDWISQGLALDITEIVTKYNPSEYCMIQDRMDDAQIQSVSVDGKYFALPTYSMAQGLVYNKALFDEYGFYIAQSGKEIIGKKGGVKSAGPDGITGTSDDGLPVTYEEFYMLCEFMVSVAVTPIGFAGEQKDFYLGGLFDALIANDSGSYVTEWNYSMKSEMSLDLVSTMNNGIPVVEKVTVAPAIGYEAFREVGKYQALKFMETLKNDGAYSFYNSFGSFIDAQKHFVIGQYQANKYPVAMLADGVYWYQEAAEIFEIAKVLYNVEEKDFAFGWMPLPRSSADKAGEQNVYLEGTDAVCFIKSSVDEVQQEIAKEFLRFLYTEKEMKYFTETTNAPWAMWYGFGGMEKSLEKMSSFGRSVWEFRQNACVVYTRDTVLGNYTMAATCEDGRYSARIGGTEYKNPIQAIFNGKVSAEDYFNGMYQYNRQLWNN